jgi:hypothetical protein
MWEKTINLFKSGAAMLQSGKFPPNTPPQYQEELGGINFLRSKKFFIVFFSIIVLFLYFGAGTFVLFMTAPFPTLTVPFVTMFTKAIEILAIIIAAFLGVQTAVDLKYNSTSNSDLHGENINVVETKRIIREGDGNAPKIKPFSVIAIEE